MKPSKVFAALCVALILPFLSTAQSSSDEIMGTWYAQSVVSYQTEINGQSLWMDSFPTYLWESRERGVTVTFQQVQVAIGPEAMNITKGDQTETCAYSYDSHTKRLTFIYDEEDYSFTVHFVHGKDAENNDVERLIWSFDGEDGRTSYVLLDQ